MTSQPPATGASPGGTARSPAEQDSPGGVQEKAQQLGGQAQEQAKQVAGKAKGRLREQVDQRSTQAAGQLRGHADDVRGVAEELRTKGKEQPAKIAEQAADRAQRLGDYLERSDGDRILGDIEDFGRRKPWAFMLGGLALGFAAARFLKASSQERYRASFERAEPHGGEGGNGHAPGTTEESSQASLQGAGAGSPYTGA